MYRSKVKKIVSTVVQRGYTTYFGYLLFILVQLVALVVALGVTTVHSAISNAQETLNATLRNAAQNALNAIGSKRTLFASGNRVARGQHVFNNGLLGIHRSVLQELLRDVGGYDEQLKNLMRDLVIPLSQTEQNAIRYIMVARFSPGEFYVDYNADVYGAYVVTLRTALVAYLKADTSVNRNERYRIQKIRQRVRFVATQMVNRDVYVDPMARHHWLQGNPRGEQQYKQVRRALRNMFENILLDFKKVADKIRVFRWRNKWSWDKK